MTGGELSAAWLADLTDAEGMCRNCLTPWKCNGPHLSTPQDYANALDAAEARVAAAEAERDGHREAAGQWAKAAKEDHARAEALDRANAVLIEARDHAQAENRRLAALVEAGLALADRWDRENRRPQNASDQVMAGVWAATKSDAAELRAALGGTA
jgi:hypothetical protein